MQSTLLLWYLVNVSHVFEDISLHTSDTFTKSAVLLMSLTLLRVDTMSFKQIILWQIKLIVVINRNNTSYSHNPSSSMWL